MSDRIRLDDLTSDQLDALYARLEHAEAAVFRMRDRAEVATVRADRAEAAIERVRAVLATRDWPHAEVRAADIRAALDQPQQPTTPPVHLAKGTNAEDCPACKGTNPPYPFLCPGTTEQQPTT